jgi:DmsE family decaheme c-type cytochrome
MRSLDGLLLGALVAIVVTVPGIVSASESDCALCHEDVVTAFERTAHARAPGWDPATGCQGCHGPGDEHMDAGGDPEAIVRPQLLPARQSSDGCLTCHDRHASQFGTRRSEHRLHEVGCLDCHDPHRAVNNLLLRDTVDLCASCHAASAAQFDLPRSHPLERGGDACVTCHDPHTPRSLRASPSTATRVCDSCHFDKTGPYVYDHGTLTVDGCGSCHEAHGSTNRHLVRHDSQVNLCYECHNANITPGWHSARRYVDQKCTSCHVAIHGSNTSQYFLEE